VLVGVGSIFGGAGGLVAGMALGSLIFPGIGTIVGGVIGAISGSIGGQQLSIKAYKSLDD
jgi:hypothetical protein